MIVAESSQGPNLPPKLRVCQNASRGGLAENGITMESINSFVEKDKFPTTFDSVRLRYLLSNIGHWHWQRDNSLRSGPENSI
ncbi:hypothetical protein GGU11DRAFT_801637 [Lentinula aff. detonsa]|nr:hypothetical protein GGU11DRAFT_801637 [Lentinula aff. detonsa]